MSRRTAESTSRGTWQCTACQAFFTRESNYNRHVDVCPYVRSRSSTLWQRSLADFKKAVGLVGSKKRPREEGCSHGDASKQDATPGSSAGTKRGRFTRQREAWSREVHGRSSERVETENTSDSDGTQREPSYLFTADCELAPGPSADDNLGDCLSAPLNPLLPHDVSDPLPPKRVRRPTAKVLDMLPEGPGRLEPIHSAPETMHDANQPTSTARRVLLHVSEKVRTSRNRFGLSREYRRRPPRIPDANPTWRSLISEPVATNDSLPRKKRSIRDIIWPYPNISSFIWNRFWLSHSQLSESARDECRDSVLLSPHFVPSDVQGVNMKNIEEKIASDVQSPWGSNGWQRSTYTLDIPTGVKQTKATQREKASAHAEARHYRRIDAEADPYPRHKIPIHDIHHRSLCHIIRESATENPAANDYHHHGYEETWTPPYPGLPPERVFGEVWTSDVFLSAERDLLSSRPEGLCTLPRAIWPVMVWSDATHLAQFGQAKAWPIYVYDGGQSKYTRCGSGAAHHLAYIPPLPPTFKKTLEDLGVEPKPALLAHCRRELFHGVWRLILDDEFREACEHGMVVDCIDGIRRRIYPRIFSYSADYPEKVLIATIRDMGGCPCPRCKIKKGDLDKAGTEQDARDRVDHARVDNDEFRSKVEAARTEIFENGYTIDSNARVEPILKPESLVPTENTFSTFFSESNFRFDVFLMLVIDLMHEFELGVWKALLTHLIRILYAIGMHAVSTFNDNFRQVSSFGRSTIRRFVNDVSDLKKLAARDYEDILQCCMPCFEGLFGAHDDEIQELLYLACYWHSLAKLRMHTDTSLKVLDHVTAIFTNRLRHFTDSICPAYATVETDGEYNARYRAAQRKAAQSAGKTTNIASADLPAVNIGGKRPKTFNLLTYKFHSLADYVYTIRRFGTTDSYSTQAGEFEHQVVKRRYANTNRRDIIPQLVKKDVIENVHERMAEELQKALEDGEKPGSDDQLVAEPDTANQGRQQVADEGRVHHRIATDETVRIHVRTWANLPEIQGDPAFRDFERELRRHLLARHRNVNGASDEPEYEDSDLEEVTLRNGFIYPHATATFYYTTYDVRRTWDSINVNGSRRDVMLKANEDDTPSHPFWYARVLGVYHANVYYKDSPAAERVEFFFVRWFGIDPEWRGGAAHCRLDRIGFVPDGEGQGAFGFLDPAHVIRPCHLIPAFKLKLTTRLLARSVARDMTSGDYVNWYVARFVDRDMMMRFLGWGIGHLNQADFPHEADTLVASEKDRQLQVTSGVVTPVESPRSHEDGEDVNEFDEIEDDLGDDEEFEEGLAGDADDGLEGDLDFAAAFEYE